MRSRRECDKMSLRDSNPERFPAGERVSIYRRGNTWYANWQKDGRQYRRSLQTRSKKEAILRAQRIEQEIDQDSGVTRVEPARVEQVIREYLEFAEADGRAKKTLAKYRQVCDQILSEAVRQDRLRVDQLDQRFADAFRGRLHRDGLKQKTIYNRMTILRSVVLFAFRRKMTPTDPMSGLRLKKPKPTVQPVWTPAEADEILSNAPDTYRPYLTFLRETGCRAGEAKYMSWEDIDLKGGIAYIREKDNWRPKSGDQRVVPLTDRLKQLLQSLPRRGRWVFTAPITAQHPQAGRQISERRALQCLKRVLAILGLKGHLHTFRHTYISQALSRGVPEAVVREWVGHVDPSIMRIYVHITVATSKSYVEKFAGN
jgi:integrase